MSFSVKQPKKTPPSKEPPPSKKNPLADIYSTMMEAYAPLMADMLMTQSGIQTARKTPTWDSLQVYLVAYKNSEMQPFVYKVPLGERRVVGAFLGLKTSLPGTPFVDGRGQEIIPVPWGSAVPSGIATVLNNGIAGVPPETPAQGFYFTDLATEEKWRQKLTWHGEAKELHQWVPKTIAWLKKARQLGAEGNLYVCVL